MSVQMRSDLNLNVDRRLLKSTDWRCQRNKSQISFARSDPYFTQPNPQEQLDPQVMCTPGLPGLSLWRRRPVGELGLNCGESSGSAQGHGVGGGGGGYPRQRKGSFLPALLKAVHGEGFYRTNLRSQSQTSMTRLLLALTETQMRMAILSATILLRQRDSKHCLQLSNQSI